MGGRARSARPPKSYLFLVDLIPLLYSKYMKVLVVVINDRLYGFELKNTRRIVPDIKYTPIPFVPDIFKGLALVMGEVTIVVSLNKILNIDDFKGNEELFLIIKGRENDLEELEDPFVVGDFKIGENVILLLDTQQIEEHLYESVSNFQK